MKEKIKFKISEERFFNNGKIILNSMPEDAKHIRESFSQIETIETTTRKNKNEKYEGIKADSLNKALRRCLSFNPINCETHVEDGIFFHDTKEGFDFSIYDEEYNYYHLYNYYLGTKGILNGDKKIFDLYKKMKMKKKEWNSKVDLFSDKYSSDIVVEKKRLSVVGELQFGNWALIYRDLFRLLNADSNPGIDMYIYVTAHNSLSDLLSKQTVSYKFAGKVIEENLSIIKIPIWLIGLDIERY